MSTNNDNRRYLRIITTGNIVLPMKKPTKKKQITDDQRAECAALKALFERRQEEFRAAGKRLSQYDLADHLGITQGGVNQYINGVNPLNLAVAVKFAEYLDVELSDFSDRLALEAKGLARHAAEPGASHQRSTAPKEDQPQPERALRHIFGSPKTNLIQVKSLAQIINREQGSIEVSAPAELPPNTVAYVLENDSMEGPGRKYIPRGSTLYIVEGAPPDQGKVVLASLAGAEVIGEYSLFAGKPHLRPYNTQYPAVDVTYAQIGGTLEGVYWKP